MSDSYAKALKKITSDKKNREGLMLNDYPYYNDDPGIIDRSLIDRPGEDYPATEDLVSGSEGVGHPKKGDVFLSEEERSKYPNPTNSPKKTKTEEDLQSDKIDQINNENAAKALKFMLDKYNENYEYRQLDKNIPSPKKLKARIKE
jgi:hypothetical protein